MDAVLVLNLKAQVVKVLLSLSKIPTILANHHGAGFTSENALKEVLLSSVRQKIVDSVKGKV
jgi:hypothetical protein